ncbi:MAG: hypothetical protein OXU73_01965 [Candidatus Campbellbacteria bacterium]|nr:hypothetical protein [Candidatus Campbellbacteria bacterium]
MTRHIKSEAENSGVIRANLYDCSGATRIPSYLHVCRWGNEMNLTYFSLDSLKEELKDLFQKRKGRVSLSLTSVNVVLRFMKEAEERGNKRGKCGSKIFVYTFPIFRDCDENGTKIYRFGKELVKLRKREIEDEKNGQLPLLPPFLE